MNAADYIPNLHYYIDKDTINSYVKGKTIVVTGAGGSIGSRLVEELLLYKPAKLILVDIAETPLHHCIIKVKESGINYNAYLADVRNATRIAYVFETEKPHIVFHAAAYKHVYLAENNPDEAIAVNLLGTQNVCNAAIAANISDFVLVSTDKAVNPTSIMGATKNLAEKLILYRNAQSSNTINYKIVRFGNVFNSNGSVIETFTRQLLTGKPVTLTHKNVKRYFISIADACNLVLQTLVLKSNAVVYTFDMGTPVKVASILENMITKLGVKPVSVIEIGLLPGEKLTEELYTQTAKIAKTANKKIITIEEPGYIYNIEEVCDKLKELLVNVHSPETIKRTLESVL